MAYAASHQEPYTKYPNRYTDMIKPTLTDTQRAVCDVAVRLIYGWHVSSARISTATFMAKTGKSRRAIISAKAALIERGLLVLLEEGGGRTTSRYMLDLYYDTRKSHQEEEPGVPTEPNSIAPPSMNDTPTQDTTSPSAEPTTPSTEPTPDDTTTPSSATPVEDPLPEVECQIIDDTSEVVVPPETHLPITEGAQSSSDPTMPSEPSTMVADVHSRGADRAPLPSKDLKSIININKIHTEAATPEVASEVGRATTTKQQVATVRYQFKSIFPDAVDKEDWPLFGWAVSTYGAEVCLSKLRLLYEYRKTSTIDNPKGLFRTALTRDYQPTRWVQTKLRTEEAAKLAIERSRKEAEERRAMIQEYDYGAATTSLSKLMETLN